MCPDLESMLENQQIKMRREIWSHNQISQFTLVKDRNYPCLIYPPISHSEQ